MFIYFLDTRKKQVELSHLPKVGYFFIFSNYEIKLLYFKLTHEKTGWASQPSKEVKTVWSFLIIEQQKVIIKLITFLIFIHFKLLHFNLF